MKKYGQYCLLGSDVTCTSSSFVNFYLTAWHQISEESTYHCCENLNVTKHKSDKK
jgi:hypothetical protein